MCELFPWAAQMSHSGDPWVQMDDDEDDVRCECAQECAPVLHADQWAGFLWGVLISILPISSSSTQSQLNNAVIYWLSPLTSIYCVTSIIYSAWDITSLKWLWMQRTCLNNCFSSGIATSGFLTVIAALCLSQGDRPEGSISNYCIRSECTVFAVSAWHSSQW